MSCESPRMAVFGRTLAPVSPRAARRMPLAAAGLRVGLFGGSFNPAHAAHRAASLLAMRKLGLDRVWWLVTPGNPLKDNRELPSLEARVAFARQVAHHPRIDVTGFEAALGVRYSYETVRYLACHMPRVRFVWIMGADNLVHFDRWQRWRSIAELMPMAVVDRMGESLAAPASVAARALARYRIEESDARLLPSLAPPAWVFLHGLKSPMSSTGIRAAQRLGAGTPSA